MNVAIERADMVATDSIVEAADQLLDLSSATIVAREVTLLAIAEAVVVTVAGIGAVIDATTDVAVAPEVEAEAEVDDLHQDVQPGSPSLRIFLIIF